jgi:hypothetical protein
MEHVKSDYIKRLITLTSDNIKRLSLYQSFFLNLGSRTPPVTLARMKYPRPSVEELRESMSNSSFISFIVGRNPFERLVSAYRDKILNPIKRSHHFKLGQV